jgi:hypothetical protein
MTHHSPPDKAVAATRSEFLDALYQAADPKLWLELRCIHPVSKQVKTLWMPLQKRTAILRQADQLNSDGYSLYFAPCPRSKQKGNAEAAALLPALWVDLDCDNDPARRESALAKLNAFVPAPSIIVDSGGGWHSYWLLSEPFPLTDQANWEYAARLLRGLFCVLGADPEYVKSVASIIRLPESVNTKPERGGAIVTVVEFAPDRRYPISEFAWLDVKAEQPARLFSPSDRPPLPRATLDYLAHGATDGTRNNALFDAACQFRDAGYSQAEAEVQLVSRYVADGNGENPSSREREARATIVSAYKRTARDPLSQPPGREQVNDLVRRFNPDGVAPERPGAEQIAAAVTACGDLDPIQWAAERKRIKAICGEEYRLSDLDRMYRQARREATRTRLTAGASPSERYFEIDGCIVYERQTERGTLKQIVAAWTGRVLEWITQVNDDGQAEHVMRLELGQAERNLILDVPSELFGDTNALQRFIAAQAGGIYTVRAGMSKHLVPALLALSGTPPQLTTYRFVGWTQRDGQWVYVSPQTSVNAQGYLTQPPEVEVETRLRDYGLSREEWSSSLNAFTRAVAVLPKRLAPALIAFAMLPVVQRFFPAAAPHPAIHLVGTSGSGKSEIAALLCSFYGRFTRDTPPAQWGDTVNTVETLGYTLADALYWVDDYKTCYADERTFTRFLQSYSRGMGRGRLTREAKLRQERPCRGLLLSTGETTIEGEASVMSRMLALEIPPWEQRDPQGKALAQAEALRECLSGFTAHFASWVAGRADSGGLTKELAKGFETSVQGYRDKLNAVIGRRANTGRMIQNWAVLVTVYRLIRQFLLEHDADDVLPGWQDAIVETVRAVQDERAGQVFMDTLGQLLASGQVMLAADMRNPEEPRPGTTIVGYLDGQHVYLLPEIAYREVNRGQPLKFTTTAIGAQLKEEGWLIPGANNLTVQRRVRGIATRFWQLRADFLNGEAPSES